ncbi:MAG: hypothetical protein GY719_19765 [bacterium]|nr:hypothetical protein [bacterium]
MSELDRFHAALRPSLRGISESEVRASLEGLESLLEAQPRHRTQLTINRLKFAGEKHGDFSFQPGVNVLRAGNDKGKSSILKLIQFCLTGKNDLKKDVDAWISEVELYFELDGEPHALLADKTGRPRGRLVRLTTIGGTEPGLDPLHGAAVLLEFKNGKQMQRELETFFNSAFGLRPLMGTQKSSRKDSDALLDSRTSYRAYFRGMYINQDLGYTALVTDGMPYGNLFMKVVGMLLGVRGIDAFFAVEARRAHLENLLAKEERYHRRLEESRRRRANGTSRRGRADGTTLQLPDLATLDEEIDRLERYIDELKIERTALYVRATSNDLDSRLAEVTEKLIAFDDIRQQTASHLRGAELDLSTAEQEEAELTTALESHRALAPIQPERCPVCETRIAERRTRATQQAGQCVLCHEDLPDEGGDTFESIVGQRLARARESIEEQRRRLDARRTDLEELGFRANQSLQLKTHLQTQLRSAHQKTADMDREIELETRYLGRLEAERENTARVVSDDTESDTAQLRRRKQILDAVLRHLRTMHADTNERMKQEFAERVQEFCTTIGFPGLEEIRFDAQLKPWVRQHGKVYAFDELSPGEKVRFVLAFYLALAIATAEDLETGAHPGLLLIDSPGKEEMVVRDFEAVVHLLRLIEDRHAANIQVIVSTSVPAVRNATGPDKQVFIDNDDDPLFG